VAVGRDYFTIEPIRRSLSDVTLVFGWLLFALAFGLGLLAGWLVWA